MSREHRQEQLGRSILHYLSEEREYHTELTRLLGLVASGQVNAQTGAMIEHLLTRREEIDAARSQLDSSAVGHQDHSELPRPKPLSTLAEGCPAPLREEIYSQIRDVRELVVRVRWSTERLGRRLESLRICFEGVLRGESTDRTGCYDSEGRWQPQRVSRSLFCQRG